MARSPGGAGSSLQAWDHTGRLFPMYGAEPGSLYAVRPDGHVFARWRQADAAALAAAIERVLH
jgi:3-(3-hydroxy-phenyl)propionate hydroxylase